MPRSRASPPRSRESTSRRSSLLGYVVTQGLAIVNSRRSQQLLLAIIVIVHVAVGSISVLFGIIYLTLRLYSDWASDLLAILGLEFNPPVAVAAFILSAVCGIAHVTQALRAICPTCISKTRSFRVGGIHGPQTPVVKFVDRRKGKSWHKIIRGATFRATASVGIRGQHFDNFFLVREVLTIGMQTYQCYRLSTSIVKPSIHNVAISLLVINCISTPIIHYVGRRWHLLSMRLLCLVFDTVIDLTTSLVMPLVTLLPYYLTFVQSSPTRSDSRLNDAVYVATAHGELGMVFVNSGATCAMLYTPAITLLFCMTDLKLLLIHILNQSKAQALHPAWEKSPTRTNGNHTSRFHRGAQLALLAYGVAVAVVSLASHATLPHEKHSLCQLPLHPWSSQRVSCGVVVIDCVREDIAGFANEIQFCLEEYDLAVIQAVTLAHCPQLEMPSTLQQLRKLLILEIYNSTIAAWGREAEIMADLQPEITSVIIAAANLTQLGDVIPPALLGRNIPTSLSTLAFANTYLRDIPPDFHLKWKHRLLSLHFNDCGLEKLPEGFSNLKVVYKLSLSGNELTSLPPYFFNGRMTQRVNLCNNPIKLQDVGNATRLLLLSVQDTLVDVIPQWVLKASPLLIAGARSPICQDMPASKLLGNTNVTCTEMDPSLFSFALADWIKVRGLVHSRN